MQTITNLMGKNTTRVQLDLPEGAMQMLNNLKIRTDANTNAEVIRNALISYAWIADFYQRGEKLLIKPLSGEVREIEFIGFTLMTLGNRRRQIIDSLRAQDVADLRILEEEMYLAFPIENFDQAEASGKTGTQLIDKKAFDEWLKEIGLIRKGSKLLQGGLGERYIGVERT